MQATKSNWHGPLGGDENLRWGRPPRTPFAFTGQDCWKSWHGLPLSQLCRAVPAATGGEAPVWSLISLSFQHLTCVIESYMSLYFASVPAEGKRISEAARAFIHKTASTILMVLTLVRACMVIPRIHPRTDMIRKAPYTRKTVNLNR